MEEKNENNEENEIKENEQDDKYINKKRNRDKDEDVDLLTKYKNLLTIPGFDGPLITFELFVKIQKNQDDFPKDELEKVYNEYKEKYENKKYMSFYHEHCDDEWFKERYHPIIKNEIKKEQSFQCKTLEKIFLESFKNKIYDNIDLSYDNGNYDKYIYESYNFISSKEIENKENKNEENKNTYFAFEPDNKTLFIHQFPRNIKKLELLSILKKIKGFVSLSLSDPIKNQNFNRYCWLSFDSNENCDVAYALLKDYKMNNSYKLSPAKSKAGTDKKIRVAPIFYGENGRDLKMDIQSTEKIIEILDKKKELNNILNEFKKNDKYNNDDFFHLNINLLYLRKIHGFCFYCCEIFDDERYLSTKCDYSHIYYNNEENFDIDYSKTLDDKIHEFIDKISIENTEDYKSLINQEEKIEKFLDKNIIQLTPEKFECNICQKKFISDHYMKKHINNMHKDKIKEVINTELKKINFNMDSNKKQYEKIKIISEMKDYASYLNAMRKYQNPNNKKGGYSKLKQKKRDYYDDKTNYKEGRKLISYQDL